MRRAMLWPVGLVVAALLAFTGCADKQTNPFDPSQDRHPPTVTDFDYSDGVATWATDEPALCVLEYGVLDGAYTNYVYESTKTHSTEHEVTLLGMEDGVEYGVRVRSRDRAGNEEWQSAAIYPFSITGVSFDEPTMRLSVIDVGWGLSMAFETPGGTKVLIDSGSDNHVDDVMDFLYDQDITYLDYAVATHHHADHVGGFEEDGGILDNFWVGTFILPDTTYLLDTMNSDLRDKLDEHSIDVVYVKQGDDSSNHEALDWDDTEDFFVQVLSAGVGMQFIDDPDYLPEGVEGNNDSIVFRFTFGDVVFLAMADAEFFVEHYILDYYGGDGVWADVMQVAHHANDDATSELWLDNVDPRVGLISNAMVEAALEKEVTLQGLRAVGADYFATDRIVPNTPRDDEPTYGHLIAITDGWTVEIATVEHPW